jgi:hypothetical protein
MLKCGRLSVLQQPQLGGEGGGLLSPLALLPYGIAQAAWLGISIATVAGSLALLLPAALFVLMPVALAGVNLLTPILAVSMAVLMDEASGGTFSRTGLTLVRVAQSGRKVSAAKYALAGVASAAVGIWKGGSGREEVSHAEP